MEGVNDRSYCVLGRIRRYNKEERRWKPWDDLLVPNSVPTNESLYFRNNRLITLRRGGTVKILSNMISESRRTLIAQEMAESNQYRQYRMSKIFDEPRVHVLLVSERQHVSGDNQATMPGYKYHGVSMKGARLESEPQVARLSEDLAANFALPDRVWNTGVDMIVYRGGNDKIGWHADDTQGEALILCVVTSSPGGARTIRIRPKAKGKKALQEGDEEIDLMIPEGSGYLMDGRMQESYEHCVPSDRKCKHPRMVLIFRHGSENFVSGDSGELLNDIVPRGQPILRPVSPKPSTTFGPMKSVLDEGTTYYDRRTLFTTRAHRADQRGVNGNVTDGCDSIIVSNHDGEEIHKFVYKTTTRLGAGSLYKSFSSELPIRVFRSSRVPSMFAPPMKDKTRHQYRYDGLYKVVRVTDGDTVLTCFPDPKLKGRLYHFHLERLSVNNGRTRSERTRIAETAIHLNAISSDQLNQHVHDERKNAALCFFDWEKHQAALSMLELLKQEVILNGKPETRDEEYIHRSSSDPLVDQCHAEPMICVDADLAKSPPWQPNAAFSIGLRSLGDFHENLMQNGRFVANGIAPSPYHNSLSNLSPNPQGRQNDASVEQYSLNCTQSPNGTPPSDRCDHINQNLRPARLLPPPYNLSSWNPQVRQNDRSDRIHHINPHGTPPEPHKTTEATPLTKRRKMCEEQSDSELMTPSSGTQKQYQSARLAVLPMNDESPPLESRGPQSQQEAGTSSRTSRSKVGNADDEPPSSQKAVHSTTMLKSNRVKTLRKQRVARTAKVTFHNKVVKRKNENEAEYFYVFNFSEDKSRLKLVPLVRQGELVGKRLGRPRYKAIVTDHSAAPLLPSSDYEIVPAAIVTKTPVVARESWDILE